MRYGLTTSKLFISLLSAASLVAAACGSDEPGSVGADTSDPTDVRDDDASDTGAVDDDTAVTDTSVDDGTTDVSTTPTLVEIVAPLNDEGVREEVEVHLVPVGRDELKVDNVALRVNGFTVFQDTKLPTSFVLDTRGHGPGALTLEAVAQAGFQQGSHEVTIYPNNPPITFDVVTPQQRIVRNGQVVSVLVTVDGPAELTIAADFSAVDSEYTPGAETSYPIGGGTYSVSYIISSANTRPNGVHRVPVTASVGGWEVHYEQLSLTLQNQPLSPINVRGGIFVDDSLPQPTAGWAVDPPELTGDGDYIVTGGSSAMTAEFGDTPGLGDMVGLIVGLEGHSGYFHVPLDDSSGTEALLVFLRAYASFESPPPILVVRAALRDRRGRVSPYGTHMFTVAAVGSGDIQVSLTWDSSADIDLHVVDPYGDEIYYGNRTISSGGELDLDSNAGCGGADVRAENVYWPTGQAPIGTYVVRVNHWSDCSGNNTNWTLTVNVCGRTEIYEGYFAAGTSSGGGLGSGAVVATISNAQCQTLVRGRVRYEDRTFDETGFGARSWLPVRNAVVELRRLSDASVLGQATTDRAGDYELQFTNDGPPGLVLVVKARTDAEEGLRDIEVLDHPKFKRLYEVSTPPILLNPNQEVVIQDLDIGVGLNAGAFNIFDVLQRGYDLVRRMTGGELGELTAFWATGSDTTETFYCSKFLYDGGACTDLSTVSVQGKDTDRDEYDDMVILKEFFRFAVDELGAHDHPGGAVDGTRDQPARAWLEGLTTFFANDVLDTRYFVNSQPSGVYLVDDLERMESPFAYRTSDGTQASELAPGLVAALLWDLADGPDAEPFDTIYRLQAGIYDTVFNYLGSEDYVDRGAPGVDLTDFLDGWFCRGWANRVAVQTLLDSRELDYDFGGPTECNAP